MEGFFFSNMSTTKKGIEVSSSVIEECDFKYRSILYQSRPNTIEFLQLCYDTFEVQIWSSKGVTDGRSFFKKFIG